MPRVELLWWEGCPSHPRALGDLRGAMSAAGLDPGDVAGARGSHASARRRTRASSARPPSASTAATSSPRPRTSRRALTCRVYRLRDGRLSPTPDPADLRDALLAAVGAGTRA